MSRGVHHFVPSTPSSAFPSYFPLTPLPLVLSILRSPLSPSLAAPSLHSSPL